MGRFLLSAGLSLWLLMGCITSRGIPHTSLKVPSLRLHGEIIRQRGAESIRVIQHTGYGGVDAFFLLREPFLKDLLEMDYYENSIWGVRVVSVPVKNHGKFERLFESTSFYGVVYSSDYSKLSYIALVIGLADDPDNIFGIEFNDDVPQMYKFNRTEWQFEAIENSDSTSMLSVEVLPPNPILVDERKVSIKIKY